MYNNNFIFSISVMVVFISCLFCSMASYAADPSKPVITKAKHHQKKSVQSKKVTHKAKYENIQTNEDDSHSANHSEPWLTPSAVLIATSNFMWRGRSISEDNEGLQAIFALTTKYGLYGNVFVGNVGFPVGEQRTKVLVIPSIGYTHKFGDLGLDFGISKYVYSDTHGIDWYEGYVSLNFKFIIAGAYYSLNFLQTGNKALVYYYGIKYKLPDDNIITRGLVLKAIMGRNVFASGSLKNNDFNYYEIGAEKDLGHGFVLSLFFDNSNADENVIPFSGKHVVVSLIKKF